MQAIPLNIYVEQGADFLLELTLSDPKTGLPINLTGVTGVGQIRTNYNSPDVLATLSVALNPDPTDGVLLVTMSHTVTGDIPVLPQPAGQVKKLITQYQYDLDITDSQGEVFRILDGIANISPRVTQT